MWIKLSSGKRSNGKAKLLQKEVFSFVFLAYCYIFCLSSEVIALINMSIRRLL